MDWFGTPNIIPVTELKMLFKKWNVKYYNTKVLLWLKNCQWNPKRPKNPRKDLLENWQWDRKTKAKKQSNDVYQRSLFLNRVNHYQLNFYAWAKLKSGFLGLLICLSFFCCHFFCLSFFCCHFFIVTSESVNSVGKVTKVVITLWLPCQTRQGIAFPDACTLKAVSA